MRHTAESNFSNFEIEYLGEIETEFENSLACLSGAQIGSNHEKAGGRKSRDTLPLNQCRVKPTVLIQTEHKRTIAIKSSW